MIGLFEDVIFKNISSKILNENLQFYFWTWMALKHV